MQSKTYKIIVDFRMDTLITKICTLEFWMKVLSFAWVLFNFLVMALILVVTIYPADPYPKTPVDLRIGDNYSHTGRWESFDYIFAVVGCTAVILLSVLWLYGAFKVS